MAISFASFDCDFELKEKRKIKSWLKQCIELEGFISGEIAVIFTSDEYLKQINEQYLNHNYFTDIITFPYSENPICGDLFISIPRVSDNALLFNTGFENELMRVIIHGVLHLMGYSDMSAREKKLMQAKEDELLKLMDVSRGTFN